MSMTKVSAAVKGKRVRRCAEANLCIHTVTGEIALFVGVMKRITLVPPADEQIMMGAVRDTHEWGSPVWQPYDGVVRLQSCSYEESATINSECHAEVHAASAGISCDKQQS